MKVKTNIHGSRLFYTDEDTVFVLDTQGNGKLNQKMSDDQFDYVTVYISKDEIIKLAEELKKQ